MFEVPWFNNFLSDHWTVQSNEETIVENECIDVVPHIVIAIYVLAFVLLCSIWIKCISKWLNISITDRRFSFGISNNGTTFLRSEDLTTGVELIKVIVEQVVEQLERASNQQEKMKAEIYSLKQQIEQQRQMCLEVEIPLQNATFQRIQSKIIAIESAMCEHGDLLKEHLELPFVSSNETESPNNLVKTEPNVDDDSSKSLTVALKKTMGEFLQDAKKQLAKERSEVMLDTKQMFAQIVEERDEIVCFVHGAMQTFTQQSLRCSERTGEVGQDAVLMQNRLEVNAKERLSKFDSRLIQLCEQLKNMNADVGGLKTALDAIDVQIDHVYHRLEMGHQSNTEEAQQIFNFLNEEAEKRSAKTAQLGNVVDKIYSLVVEAKDAMSSAEANQKELIENQMKEVQEQISCMTKDMISSYEQNMDQDIMEVLPSFLSICFNKLDGLGCAIDQETADIQTIMTDFRRKLEDLFNSAQVTVEKLDQLQLKGGGEGDQKHKKHHCQKHECRKTSAALIALKKSISPKRTPKTDAMAIVKPNTMSPAKHYRRSIPEPQKSKTQSPMRKVPSPRRKISANTLTSRKAIASPPRKISPSAPSTPSPPKPSSPKRSPKKIQKLQPRKTSKIPKPILKKTI